MQEGNREKKCSTKNRVALITKNMENRSSKLPTELQRFKHNSKIVFDFILVTKDLQRSRPNFNLNFVFLPTCRTGDYHQQHELDTPIIFETQVISMSPVFKVEMFQYVQITSRNMHLGFLVSAPVMSCVSCKGISKYPQPQKNLLNNP